MAVVRASLNTLAASTRKDVLLPAVHALWPAIIARLQELTTLLLRQRAQLEAVMKSDRSTRAFLTLDESSLLSSSREKCLLALDKPKDEGTKSANMGINAVINNGSWGQYGSQDSEVSLADGKRGLLLLPPLLDVCALISDITTDFFSTCYI